MEIKLSLKILPSSYPNLAVLYEQHSVNVY